MKKINKLLLSLSPISFALPLITLSCSSKKKLNENGGTQNGLYADKYLEILKQLDLKSNTNFEELNSTFLNNKLHQNNEYKNLNLEIAENTNSMEKILFINLKGNIYGNEINEQIKITGFDNNTYENYFSINNISLNLDQWFNNKQPIIEKNNLTLVNQIDQKKSLFETINFSFTESNKNIKLFSFKEVQEKFNIQKFNLLLNKNNEIELEIELKTKYVIFANNTWKLIEDEKQQILRQKINSNNKLLIPSLNDLKKYMLNSMTLNSDELSQYFASYFYGDSLYNWKENSSLTHQFILSFINYNLVFEKYKSTYFLERNLYLELTNDMDLFDANEQNHSLNFVVTLIDDTVLDDKSIVRNFEFQGMKDLNQYLNTIKGNVNNIFIKENSINYNVIKTNFRSQILEVFQSGITKEFNLTKFPIQNLTLFNYELFNSNVSLISQTNNNYDNIAALSKQFSISNEIGNDIINGILNAKNGLITINENSNFEKNSLFINSISLKPSNSDLIEIKRREYNSDIVEISIKTKLLVELEELSFEEDVLLRLNILKSNFETNNQNDIKILNERIAHKLFNSKETLSQIDVSDLTLTRNDILDSWRFFINKMYSLFPYFSTSSNGKYFFETENEKVTKINLNFREYDRDLIKKDAIKLSETYTNLIKYAPINTNDLNNAFWILQKVSDWMWYSKKDLDNQTFSSALLNNKGVCESYSKLTHVLFNSFNIESTFQPGNIKSDNSLSAGPHLWNQYKINNDWFNIDTTFADTSVSGLTNTITTRMTNTSYLAFLNSKYTFTREYLDNWYENKHETNYDISNFKNYVPFSALINNNFTRMVVIQDKWYFIENNNIIESNLENTNRKTIYQFSNLEYSKYGLYQIGNRFYFVDYINNKSVLQLYDITTKTFEQLKVFDQLVNKFIVNNQNQIVISLQNQSIDEIIIDSNNIYNFLQEKNIYSIKTMFTINSLWLNSISIGNNINELSIENFNIIFNKLFEIANSKTYNEDIYIFMINFKEIVSQLLNK